MTRRVRAGFLAICTLGGMHCGTPGAANPLASPAAAERRTQVERPMPGFLVGYNEGWFGPHYGSDLTKNYDRAVVRLTLDGIAKAGGRVVRLWLFEARQGIVLGEVAPQIRGVDPQMLTNLGEVLDEARARGLWVYLTLLDGNEMPVEPGPLRDFFWNLLNDAHGEGAAFHDKILAPLLVSLGVKRDVIYGLDLVNEIEAPRHRSFWPERFVAPRAFMSRTASFVKTKAPWLKITSSAGWDTAAEDISNGFFSGVGLDFYDLHVYSDAGAIGGLSDVCARSARDRTPVILGEFGQRSHVTDDTLQSSATRAFLSAASSSCLVAALSWRYDAAEPWLHFVRNDGSHRPAVSVMQQFATSR